VVAPLAAPGPSPLRGIVTPEAVVLEFDTAGVPSRAVARVIDASLVLFLLSTLSGILAPAFGDDAYGALIAGILVTTVVVFGYPILCEVVWGRTLGHLVFGLRVVTEEGGPVRFRHSAVRSLLQVVDIFLVPIGVVAVISALASPRDQRLGDRLAGTLVIRLPATTAQSNAIAFPPLPGYEGYVASLDTGGITTDGYEVLRSFLTRVNELTPAARHHLAGRLVGPMGAAVGQLPPPSMDAEVFLASIAASYQRRNGGPATWAWGPTGQPPLRSAGP
jgi:uncharacterized RDD family membrane protein YckC